MACFRNPAYGNDHNRAAPGDDRAACWNTVGLLHGQFAVVALGPRLVCTAGHLGGITVGVTPIDFGDGITRTVTSITLSTTADAQYLQISADVPGAWARLWDLESYTTTTNLLVMHGAGLGRGTEIIEGGTLVGWNPGDDFTRARRWSMGTLFELDINPPVGLNTDFSSKFEPELSDVAYAFNGDSGSPCFIDVGTGTGINKWLYIGPCVAGYPPDVARFDTTTYGIIGSAVWKDKAIIDALNGDIVIPKTIYISYPPDGFDMAGSVLPITGVVTGDVEQVTVRVNSSLRRTAVSAEGTFAVFITIPVFPEPSLLTIDAFDGTSYANSTIFSNIVHGQAVNLPLPGPQPPPSYWVEDGYETLLQSECSLYANDSDKTVTALCLDFAHAEEAPPLLGHSQLGVGGLPSCIDWWNSKPWALYCNDKYVDPRINPPEPTRIRGTGPLTWPYYSTGRYVAWRIFLSNSPTSTVPLTFEPKGGVIDFNRVRLKLQLQSDC
jgi:hypothetical protein